MVSNDVSNVAYILFIILGITGAIYDIVNKQYANLYFISFILITISMIINYPTFKKHKQLLYLPAYILLFIAVCIQTYSNYEEDKKFTYRITFMILFLISLLWLILSKIYHNKVIYY